MKNKINFCQFGFTLLEVLTVLAVLTVLLVVGLPVYRQIQPSLDLNSALRDMASDLRWAQQLAVTEQNVYRVAFNSANNYYEVINTASNEVIKHKNLSSQLRLQTIAGLTDNAVNFNATGAAIENGSVTLINSQNQTATIDIKPSGYVKIQN
jgi:prepilin-type N-terminal cleavage/methylation domain-containing protein